MQALMQTEIEKNKKIVRKFIFLCDKFNNTMRIETIYLNKIKFAKFDIRVRLI